MLLSPEPRPRYALRATGVTKLFGETIALWNVVAGCLSGELLAIHGANGSGKSTLLHVVAGLAAPTRGTIAWASNAPGTPPRIALLGHATHLFEELTSIENVALAAQLATGSDRAAVGLLSSLGVERYAGRKAKDLSAGTRRRVGLARALATDPDVLLVDEPFAGLDDTAAELVSTALSSARDEGRLVVIATHDGVRTRPIASRTVELEAGRVRSADVSRVKTAAT